MAALEMEATCIFQDSSIPVMKDILMVKSDETTEDANLYVSWEQINYSTQKKSSFLTLYSLTEKKLQKLTVFPIENSKPLLETVSLTNKQKAVIRKNTNKTTNKDEYILEIWSSDKMKIEKALNLSSFDLHGDVNADIIFSSLCWSPDNTKLLYIAEKKKEKSIGFFEKPSNDAKDVQYGNKFVYTENWGELLTDATNPVICIVDILKETVNICFNKDMEGINPSQPQWGPGNSIVFSGLKVAPFRLGRIYCENRIGHVYMLTLIDGGDSVLTRLSEDIDSSNTCPRLNPSMTKVAFIQRKLHSTGDPHRSNETVVIFDFKEKRLQNLSPMIGDKSMELFSHMLPRNIWLNDRYIAVPNCHNGRMHACVVDVLSDKISSMVECSTFFGAQDNMILSSMAKLNGDNVKIQVALLDEGTITDIITDPALSLGVPGFSTEVLINEHSVYSFSMVPDVRNGKIPLIVCAHGGPHSVFTDDYSATFVAFCKLGFAVLLVNYRGSTSFSEESLLSLPGNVGDQDVKEVHETVNKFIIEKKDVIDVQNIFYVGGSHGGFLGAHLVGQYPDFYCAAALRNPVIDIASMSMVTDIPDWCYVEAGIPYHHGIIPNSDDYKQMLSKSPIVHLQSIKAPILLCIGGKDARVPPSQGKGFYRLLKANGKTTKLLFYPDESHPLMKEVVSDVFMNTYRWFMAYMKK